MGTLRNPEDKTPPPEDPTLAKALTANATADGRPVYWTAASTWSERVAEAATTRDADVLAAWLAAAKRDESLACDVYAIDVHVTGAPVPHSLREKIRAHGPTVVAS